VQVRHGFLEALQKALGRGALAQRWYTLCFLATFEPNDQFKDKMVRWLKNRAEHYRNSNQRVGLIVQEQVDISSWRRHSQD